MVSDKKNSKEKKDLDLPTRGKDWERGFTIEENRVSEYVELYESIGYEVRVEPATPDEIEDCQVCFKADFNNLRTIYIKRNKNKDNELDLEELL
ncbi:unnamed protein product [marine sediment metagenome]|uniref:Uncharacterized protein n=1 Tax=marine sediment metagenome TaxID=412755 RepID=X0XH02_9ZZZZ